MQPEFPILFEQSLEKELKIYYLHEKTLDGQDANHTGHMVELKVFNKQLSLTVLKLQLISE
jgi:hypothetical protein